MKYVCVHGFSSTELTRKVNDLIAEGFEPLGGVTLALAYVPEDRHDSDTSGRDMSYAQAMILP